MISILVPISNREDPKIVNQCLKSLAEQTYKDFEVLIVTSGVLAKKISQIVKEYPFAKVFKKDLSKGAARNFAAQKAKGKYLYHLDVDMTPTPQVLSACFQKAKEGAEAIIIPEVEAPQTHLISQCRALERRILRGSRAVIAPLFLKKSLFEKAGGYDEALDPADDWNLHLTLRKMGVKTKSIQPTVFAKETTSLKRALKRKYEMGRIYPALKAKYSHVPHLSPQQRFEDYFRNWRELIRYPLITLSLFFLKVGDILSFFWGTLHPLNPKNRYALVATAKEYDQKRLGNNYGRYKHFAELKSLFKLFPKKDGKILEVGCGTGRITAELIKKGYPVSPIDSSQAMLNQYQQKPGLPKPRLASATQLPFPDNSFPIVFSLRVIWHLPRKDALQMFAELARVATDFIILDITNKKRWPKIYRDRYPNEYFFAWEEFTDLCQKFNLKIEERLPLDTLAPLWLNFFPFRLARNWFPLVYKVDLWLAKFIPPGRYLIRLKKV